MLDPSYYKYENMLQGPIICRRPQTQTQEGHFFIGDIVVYLDLNHYSSSSFKAFQGFHYPSNTLPSLLRSCNALIVKPINVRTFIRRRPISGLDINPRKGEIDALRLRRAGQRDRRRVYGFISVSGKVLPGHVLENKASRGVLAAGWDLVSGPLGALLEQHWGGGYVLDGEVFEYWICQGWKWKGEESGEERTDVADQTRPIAAALRRIVRAFPAVGFDVSTSPTADECDVFDCDVLDEIELSLILSETSDRDAGGVHAGEILDVDVC